MAFEETREKLGPLVTIVDGLMEGQFVPGRRGDLVLPPDKVKEVFLAAKAWYLEQDGTLVVTDDDLLYLGTAGFNINMATGDLEQAKAHVWGNLTSYPLVGTYFAGEIEKFEAGTDVLKTGKDLALEVVRLGRFQNSGWENRIGGPEEYDEIPIGGVREKLGAHLSGKKQETASLQAYLGAIFDRKETLKAEAKKARADEGRFAGQRLYIADSVEGPFDSFISTLFND